jgi:hypothetical protein
VVGEDPDIPTWSEARNAQKLPLVPAVKIISEGMRLHMKIQTFPWDGGARIPIPVCHHGS